MNKLATLSAVLLLLAGCQQKQTDDTVPAIDTTENNIPSQEKAIVFRQQCFLSVTSGTDKRLKDSIIFSIERRKGDSIWGIFNSKPAEKDRKMATFKGVLKGSEGRAVANSQAEGMMYNEELLFTLKDSTLSIKYGEMAEGKDGIWHYKDQSKLSEQVLRKVDCK